MSKKLLFIYNPTSGRGMIRTKLSEVIETFSEAGYIVTACPTLGPTDAQDIIRAHAQEAELLVCSGGDGTLDQVVDGLVKTRPDMPMGYIPTGSTNDFGSSLGISRDPIQAARDIVEGHVERCDVGWFNDRSFVYIAAFGLFTDVAYQTDQQLKNVIGHAAYLLEAGKRIFKVPTFHIKVESEACQVEGDFIYGMVTNARSVGGMKNLPGVDVDMADGLFEVRLVHPPANPLELSEAVTALLYPKIESKLVLSFKTSAIRITAPEPLAWTLDGEYGGDHAVAQIENRSRLLHIMLNLSREEQEREENG